MTTKPTQSLLTKNWMLKLLSLVIGSCLWYFVAGEDQIDTIVKVPLEVHNLPANLVIANQFKKDIEVTVRGPRRIIQELRRLSISRPVDLTQTEPGAIVIKNDAESISFPQGIKVLRLQPTNITLLVDELVQKKYVIDPITEGEPNSGYTLASILLEPDHLMVTGPKALLDTELALKTFVINLDGLDRSTRIQVQLNLTDNFLTLIGETVVTATLTVEETILNKTVRGIPINVRDAEIPSRSEPNMVTVVAGIPENLIRDTPELAMLFRASVNAKGLKKAKEVPVIVNGINVPEHEPIEIISVKPDTVRLIPGKVLVAPLKTQSSNKAPVNTER